METHQHTRSSISLWMASRRLHDLLWYTPDGVTDRGEYGITPADVRNVAVGNAITSVLGSVGYVGPDQDGSPDVHGPAGPYIRDALIGLTVAHIAAGMSDRELGRSLEAGAFDGVARQVEQMRNSVG